MAAHPVSSPPPARDDGDDLSDYGGDAGEGGGGAVQGGGDGGGLTALDTTRFEGVRHRVMLVQRRVRAPGGDGNADGDAPSSPASRKRKLDAVGGDACEAGGGSGSVTAAAADSTTPPAAKRVKMNDSPSSAAAAAAKAPGGASIDAAPSGAPITRTSALGKLLFAPVDGPHGRKVLLARQESAADLPGDATPAGNAHAGDEAPRLYEARRHARQLSSWFIGNRVVKDGALWVLNEIDPTFHLLNVLYAKAQLTVGTGAANGQQYQTAAQLLDDVPILRPFGDHLRLICDTARAGDDVFYTFSSRRALAYLLAKVRQVERHGTVIFEWYERDANGGAATCSKQHQALQLISEYAPQGLFGELCAALDVPLSDFLRQQGRMEQLFFTNFVSRDAELSRRKEEEDEAKRKQALATASNAVKKTLKQGRPKGNMAITAFFKKK